MNDDELFAHMQVDHGFKGWSRDLYDNTYPDTPLESIHAIDHSDPEEYGISHGHKGGKR